MVIIDALMNSLFLSFADFVCIDHGDGLWPVWSLKTFYRLCPNSITSILLKTCLNQVSDKF